MAKWIRNDGIDEYIENLQKLGADTKEICGAAVYAMAGTVADAVRGNIENLTVVSDAENIKAYNTGERAHLTARQRDGLLDGFGISKMTEERGVYQVKLGFDGYNKVRTKKYKGGQPNALVARSTESGSSIMDKQPFIRPAVTAMKKTAIKNGQKAIDEKIYNIMKER